MTRHDLASRLEREIGLDPAVLGEEALGRLVVSGTRRSESPDEASYLRRLEVEPEQWKALVEDVVVPETWFMRDRRPFELIQRRARSWSIGPEGTVRALSAPCSTGEEAYSIAIALSQGGLAESRFKVTGIALSERNVRVGRSRWYRERSLRTLDEETRRRWFQEVEQGFVVAERLESCVEFVRGNVLDDACLAAEPRFQIVLCRNLLIYLTDAARRKLIEWLDRRLADDGVLIVGHAEQTRLLEERFEAIAEPGTFAYRKRGKPVASPRAGARPIKSVVARVDAGVARRIDPRPVVTREPAATIEPENELERARRLANEGRLEEAIEACTREIRRVGPSADAHELAGSISLAAGRLEAAEQHHRRAIYLDSSRAESLLALSLLARRRGDAEEADRLASRAERARRREPS